MAYTPFLVVASLAVAFAVASGTRAAPPCPWPAGPPPEAPEPRGEPVRVEDLTAAVDTGALCEQRF